MQRTFGARSTKKNALLDATEVLRPDLLTRRRPLQHTSPLVFLHTSARRLSAKSPARALHFDLLSLSRDQFLVFPQVSLFKKWMVFFEMTQVVDAHDEAAKKKKQENIL